MTQISRNSDKPLVSAPVLHMLHLDLELSRMLQKTTLDEADRKALKAALAEVDRIIDKVRTALPRWLGEVKGEEQAMAAIEERIAMAKSLLKTPRVAAVRKVKAKAKAKRRK